MMTLRDQMILRGIMLLGGGAGIALLQLVLPAAAPIAVALYGFVRGFNKRLAPQRRLFECLGGLILAVVLWWLRGPFGWILWGIGATMAGTGVYCLMLGLLGTQPKP